MLEKKLPAIDPYEEGEMRRPRTNLATFDRHFSDGQLRPKFAYLYRGDLLESDHGNISENLGRAGHQYVNPLDNFPALTSNSPEYLREMYAFKAGMAQTGRHARGLYLFSGMDGAQRMQAINLSMAQFVIDHEGVVTSVEPARALLRAATIVSRVKAKNIPEGTFFPDPTPQDSPKAVVHIVSQQGLAIPRDDIEVFIDRDWVKLSRVDLGRIISEVKAGQMNRILSF